MSPFATGAAFVDRSGSVLAADAGFVARLGLEGDLAASLRARAEHDAGLRALLAGDGPALARVVVADGEAVEIERIAAPGGALLVAREPGALEWSEHALRSRYLGRIVAGFAHDVRNPLNAMSLQIALLSEKLSSAEPPSVDGNLAALRDQIGRTNEVLRRMQDALDPAAPLGYTDLGALLADVAALLLHEARRRRVELVVDAHPGTVRTPADVARVGRLVVGACGMALARTPSASRLSLRAESRGAEAAIVIERAMDDSDRGAGYESEVLAAGAASLGGRLERTRDEGGVERLTLLMPGNDRQ